MQWCACPHAYTLMAYLRAHWVASDTSGASAVGMKASTAHTVPDHSTFITTQSSQCMRYTPQHTLHSVCKLFVRGLFLCRIWVMYVLCVCYVCAVCAVCVLFVLFVLCVLCVPCVRSPTQPFPKMVELRWVCPCGVHCALLSLDCK
jgi:hypothetical protein